MSLPRTVQDCMTVAPYTVPAELPLEIAARFMTEKRIRHLPVLKGRAVAGILSDVSLLTARAGATTVAEVMEPANVVQRATPLAEIARGMASRKLGSAVVVLDDREKVCGIFTMVDAMLVLARLLESGEPSAKQRTDVPV